MRAWVSRGVSIGIYVCIYGLCTDVLVSISSRKRRIGRKACACEAGYVVVVVFCHVGSAGFYVLFGCKGARGIWAGGTMGYGVWEMCERGGKGRREGGREGGF